MYHCDASRLMYRFVHSMRVRMIHISVKCPYLLMCLSHVPLSHIVKKRKFDPIFYMAVPFYVWKSSIRSHSRLLRLRVRAAAQPRIPGATSDGKAKPFRKYRGKAPTLRYNFSNNSFGTLQTLSTLYTLARHSGLRPASSIYTIPQTWL